jgi:hypothetical protein
MSAAGQLMTGADPERSTPPPSWATVKLTLEYDSDEELVVRGGAFQV